MGTIASETCNHFSQDFGEVTLLIIVPPLGLKGRMKSNQPRFAFPKSGEAKRTQESRLLGRAVCHQWQGESFGNRTVNPLKVREATVVDI